VLGLGVQSFAAAGLLVAFGANGPRNHIVFEIKAIKIEKIAI
jgi:hypothetical protein